jgi:hypothetical protein
MVARGLICGLDGSLRAAAAAGIRVNVRQAAPRRSIPTWMVSGCSTNGMRT